MSTSIGFVTAKNEDEAESIAKALLDSRLAACCNIIPKIKSIYRWKGNVESSEEALLIIKTQKGFEEQAINKIKAVHSYEVPAIEFIEVKNENPDSVNWIQEETRQTE